MTGAKAPGSKCLHDSGCAANDQRCEYTPGEVAFRLFCRTDDNDHRDYHERYHDYG